MRGPREAAREAHPRRARGEVLASAAHRPRPAVGSAVTIPQATVIRLEKTAVDNGFDLALPREGDWLGFASTRAPLRVWLTAVKDGLFIAALSHQNVTQALIDHGIPVRSPLPKGAVGARGVIAIPELHLLVRRAFALSRTLPDELLHSFEREIATLGATEVERVVRQRVGQDVFRRGLLDYWEGRCAITGRCRSCYARATSSRGRTARATPSGSTSSTDSCSRPTSTQRSTAD